MFGWFDIFLSPRLYERGRASRTERPDALDLRIAARVILFCRMSPFAASALST